MSLWVHVATSHYREVCEVSGRTTLTEVFGVARGSELTDSQFRLWMYYRSWQVRRGKHVGATVPDEQIARNLGRGERGIQEARKILLAKGYLRQQLRGRAVARYWAVVPEEATQHDDADSQVSARRDESQFAEICETSELDSRVDSRVDSQISADIVRAYGATSVPSLQSGTGAGAPNDSHSEDISFLGERGSAVESDPDDDGPFPESLAKLRELRQRLQAGASGHDPTDVLTGARS